MEDESLEEWYYRCKRDWERVAKAKRYFDNICNKYTMTGYERFLEAKGLQKIIAIGGYHGHN